VNNKKKKTFIAHCVYNYSPIAHTITELLLALQVMSHIYLGRQIH